MGQEIGTPTRLQGWCQTQSAIGNPSLGNCGLTVSQLLWPAYGQSMMAVDKLPADKSQQMGWSDTPLVADIIKNASFIMLPTFLRTEAGPGVWILAG